MFYCFINPKDINENIINITNENFFHLKNVRRGKIGERIKVRSDRYVYIAVIKEIQKYQIKAIIESKKQVIQNKSNLIFLAPALIQEKNFDLILQFGTQLGVDGFYPIVTKNVSNKNIKLNRESRWRKIIQSAAMQSQRLEIPFVHEACEFETIFLNKDLTSMYKILPYELEDKQKFINLNINKKQGSYIIFIGPEGGWSTSEIKTAQEYNVEIVSLGDYILRAETASLVSLTLLNSLLGNV